MQMEAKTQKRAKLMSQMKGFLMQRLKDEDMKYDEMMRFDDIS